MAVRVAKIEQSPWPYVAGRRCCHGEPVEHRAEWVVWTDQETGDGMRWSCTDHLLEWVLSVWDRIDGTPEDEV